MLTGIIIGICIMSLMAIPAIEGADKGKRILVYAFGGPSVWLIIFVIAPILKLLRKASLNYFRANYLRYDLMISPCEELTTLCLHRKVVPSFYKEGETDRYYIDFYKDCLHLNSMFDPERIITPRGFKSTKSDLPRIVKNFVKPDTKLYKKITRRRG